MMWTTCPTPPYFKCFQKHPLTKFSLKVGTVLEDSPLPLLFAPRAVDKHKKRDLQALVREHVEPGSAVYSDSLKSYGRVKSRV